MIICPHCAGIIEDDNDFVNMMMTADMDTWLEEEAMGLHDDQLPDDDPERKS